MEIAKVRVNSVSAETVFCSHVPKGAIGCTVSFEFADRAWDALNKTVVFRNRSQTLDAVLEENSAVIPHELLGKVKDSLYVGVYGTDTQQNLAIPTVWAKLGEIDSAANPSGDPATDPSLPYWAQILGEVETLREEKMGAEDLENALNQAKESGEFDGPQGEKGDQGDKGDKGEPGVTPVLGTDYWTAEDKEAMIAEASYKVLRTVSKSSDIVCSVSGEAISLADASDREFQEFRIFGKTTQNGTPAPDNPAELKSVGDSGNVSVSIVSTEAVGDLQTLTVTTLNGLPGIPVTANGNYTDKDGQQWICDEVDLARGVYIQRVGKHTTKSTDKWYANGSNNGVGTANFHAFTSCVSETLDRERKGVLCDRFAYYGSTGVGNETRLNVCSNFVGQGNIVFDVDNTIADTLDAWKTYAASHPLTIYYILASAVETPLSEEELNSIYEMHTCKTDTAISNDADAYMAVSYVADLKTYIDNLFSA